ncbi:hypothetical protein IV203_020613 [Nitzschia inconspicua]|uniref:Uncharacterized protein n=1 Tax=Nitzschia inconspicua TaxID=303405 RepID=A0A9K3KG17_9STRA|nr:hypothetical protein IV203_020613 [Nitzschia inconspicua]
MYREVKANPNSGHKLSTWISRRPESKLESFHDNLSHFASCGMRNTLCDSLNLCGTARYNLQIRHKIRLSQRSEEERNKMPVGWEEVVSYYNHSELAYVNALARDAGTDHVPFKDTEILVDDNGERFFSEYLNKNLPTPQQESDRCQCCKCATNEIPLLHENVVFSAKPPATTSPPPKLPPSPKQIEKRQSLPVDEPRWQPINPCQQSVPEQPQQQWIVAKPPIEPNFIYVPHTTATMWPANQMPLPGFQWMPPQPTHQQQAMCLPALPWMPPQPTPQQQEMCLLTLPLMPPQPTQQQMYSANTVSNGGFRCNKYFLWYISHNRKGRPPPHEHQCLDRIQYKRDMHLGQETNSSIQM